MRRALLACLFLTACSSTTSQVKRLSPQPNQPGAVTGVSAVGNESLTVSEGSYALTVSGIIDKGLAFLRVQVGNHSDQPLALSKELFSVTDGNQTVLSVLSPEEVMYFIHGPDAVTALQFPAASGQSEAHPVPETSVVRQVAPKHKSKKEWSQSDEEFVHANAAYIVKETLWPVTLAPGQEANGLIYVLAPQTPSLKVEAHFKDKVLAVSFGEPRPSANRMTQDQLAQFFEAQKKSAPIRLTLKNNHVFVGKFSSFDGINEIVWFDTPSGTVLTTSSFGLRVIAFAEAISLQQPKK